MVALKLPERARNRRLATGSLLVVAMAGLLLPWSVSRSSDSSRPATAGTALAPSVVGQTYGSALRRIAGLGLRAVELRQFSSEPEGVVLSQDTRPGAPLAAGSAIALTVSKGVARSAMPKLVGAPAAAATRRLKALQLAVLSFRVASDAPVGTVVSAFPSPGAMLRYGDQARLNVSGGIPAGVSLERLPRVPAVVGVTAERAQARLRALGLAPDLFYVRSRRPAGLVVRQSAGPRTTAQLGTLVGLAISIGPRGIAQTPVPYVVGRASAAGAELLRSTGFDVRVVRGPAPAGVNAQRVLDEQPMGGTKAPLHAVVTIVIAAGRREGGLHR